MLRIFTNRRSNASRLLSDADKARDQLQWREAANSYRLFLMERPDVAPIWVQYGHALKEGGALDEAERAYGKAIELMPRDADARLQIGHLYKMTARFPEALLSYELAYFLDPALSHAASEVLGMRAYLADASLRQLRNDVARLGGDGPMPKGDPSELGRSPHALAEYDERLRAVVSQIDHILSHVAITKALGAELARLSRRVEQQRGEAIEGLRP